MDKFNEVLERECDILQWTSDRMKELAQAFYLTGNDAAAWKLATLAQNIASVNTEIRTAFGAHLLKAFQESQREVGRVFAALREGD